MEVLSGDREVHLGGSWNGPSRFQQCVDTMSLY